jgi:undecaprenyl diphosphate synthase
MTPLAREWGLQKVPRHIGIIMDGNGRWAAGRGLLRASGHRAGVEALHDIVKASSDLGIEVLTLYAFSTENWKRPKGEVKILMELLVEFLAREIDELDANEVKIRFMGQTEDISEKVSKAVKTALKRTDDNKGMVMNIAFNYGSRDEIVRAARTLAEDVAAGKLEPAGITEEMFEGKLYTAGLPDPDLVIRTSGELRLSNFMLYQCSYAEYCAPEVLWPDFNRDELRKVLLEYQMRDRRFGGIK